MACAALVALALLPSPAVGPLAARLARDRLDGCIVADGLTIDAGTWPPIPRAALGRLRNVRLAADRVTMAGIIVRDVEARFERLDGRVVRGSRFEVSGGVLRAVLTEADLAARVPLPGVSVQIDPGGVRLDAPAPLVGAARVSLDVDAVGGDLVVRPTSLGLLSLVPIRVSLPEPVQLDEVRALAGRLALSATLDGVVDLRQFGC